MPPTPDAAEINVEEVVFAGAGNRLHGELAYPALGSAAGGVVIAGPHPLLGGTMHNNVVRGLGDGLAQRSLLTLRFDYRGVGRSEGRRLAGAENYATFWQTSHVPEEMHLAADVASAASHLRTILGSDLPLALVGYSFGCALLPQVCCAGVPLVLVAPTIAKHEYESYLPLANAKLVIASEDDFASDVDRLQAWFHRLTAPRFLILRRFDNHFFRGHEEWLTDAIFGFLCEQWR
jgi:alpha/beta superfamily hydrolase